VIARRKNLRPTNMIALLVQQVNPVTMENLAERSVSTPEGGGFVLIEELPDLFRGSKRLSSSAKICSLPTNRLKKAKVSFGRKRQDLVVDRCVA
jgi:hypothetical protein